MRAAHAILLTVCLFVMGASLMPEPAEARVAATSIGGKPALV